ncbi:chitinase [Buttiauxella gaviniae ATCC 51604]|uniref:Chitinase n=1 Tax=Buttiauxella gaviniae ATCC 51604 TaxID=1354253 RepID=A0A1B7HKQ6_9ENTR|nr:glycosyl hydrolase family 18 protein [Buttiauxella gaviniae]OAT16220.1 chitinase [Buttiauxella gaviniae ATCC 51604]
MATQAITWSWATNTHLTFNPVTDVLDFDWMQGNQFDITEKDGSVVISIPSNNQSYILDGVKLSQLSVNNIDAKDSTAMHEWQTALDTGGNRLPTDTSNAIPLTDLNTSSAAPDSTTQQSTPGSTIPEVSEPATSQIASSVESTTKTIAWDWGANTHLSFNPTTDVLDFGWMQADQFNVTEKDGSVVISIPSNDQSYVLDGVTLSQLSISNIGAKDATALAEWQSALGVTGNTNPIGSGSETSVATSDPLTPVTTPVSDPLTPVTTPVSDPLTPVTTPVSGSSSYEYAPYVDVTSWPTPDLTAISHNSGVKEFSLGFLVANSQGGLSWGGVVPIDNNAATEDTVKIDKDISSFQNSGGSIILSFGGENGTEVALNAKDANSLAALYQTAIDKYHATSIDFDIEGGAVADKKSVDMRNQAITILEKNNPGLQVSYTLPVLQNGLTQDGVNVLKSAVSNNTHVDLVNIMTMDFGGQYDSLFTGKPDMGDGTIAASDATISQMRAAGLSDTKVGITPMIGVNDDNKEIFTLEDASQVAHYAESNSDVGRIGIWSIGRDNGNGAGKPWADSAYSGMSQNDYDFSKTLMGS